MFFLLQQKLWVNSLFETNLHHIKHIHHIVFPVFFISSLLVPAVSKPPWSSLLYPPTIFSFLLPSIFLSPVPNQAGKWSLVNNISR